MENEEYIRDYLQEAVEIVESFRFMDKSEIDKAVELFFDAWKNNKKIFTMGNGGSAPTASHFSSDLSKTTIVEGKKRFKAFCLNDNVALFTAWVNDAGWENVYVGQLENVLEEGDIIVPISVHGGSGWSGNLVKAMEFAKKKKAKIIGFAAFDGGLMKEAADVCLVVPRDSTPHAESFHSVLQHLIIFCLKDKISKYTEQRNQTEINKNQ